MAAPPLRRKNNMPFKYGNMPPVPQEMPDTDGDSIGQGEGDVPVPLKCLAQPDDADQMTTPEVGDKVTFTVDAEIKRIDGEMAYVKAGAINGTPVGSEGKETGEADEGESLRKELEYAED